MVNNIIALKGAVPGHANSYIWVRDAVRLHHWQHNQKLPIVPPVPTAQEDMQGLETEHALHGVTFVPTELLKNPFTVPDN